MYVPSLPLPSHLHTYIHPYILQCLCPAPHYVARDLSPLLTHPFELPSSLFPLPCQPQLQPQPSPAKSRSRSRRASVQAYWCPAILLCVSLSLGKRGGERDCLSHTRSPDSTACIVRAVQYRTGLWVRCGGVMDSRYCTAQYIKKECR
jgi:hypothetical protein